MKRVVAWAMFLAMLLSFAACSKPETPPPPVSKLRDSGDYYTVYSGEIRTLNYLWTSTTAEFSIAANCVDGLVEHNNLGILGPSMAETWKVSDDGLVWTFNIRPGQKWYTYDKKEYAEVVAEDWVSAHKWAFDPVNDSSTANIAYSVIKNGEAYYNGLSGVSDPIDWSEVGVKAIDKYVLQYTLEYPVPYFLSMLTYVSFLPVNGQFLAEVGEDFGLDHTKMLYCGAYIITEWEHQNFRTMEKNENYWDKDSVHIKKLNYKYNKEASTLAPDLFLQGEISGATISTSILNDWLNDPARKDLVRPSSTSFYSYFYAFNFDPHFPAEYEPENWKIAVNNVNFRKSIFYGLDRKAAMLTAEPFAPESRIVNTITPKTFVAYGGKDFVQYGGLDSINKRDSFQEAEAVKYRDLAKAELAGKATFPVKIMMPYRADMADWTNRCVVIEQQLESLLGADYIDIIPVGFPATNFLGTTRRAGNYALQECNWGPDYADPETFTEPFYPGSTYNWPELAEGYTDENGKGKHENLVDLATAEVTDMARRFELFANAEAFLINEAMVIPYAVGGGGYVATKVEPFTYPYAAFGMDSEKWKGQVIMEKPMNMAQYAEARAKWEADRAAALAAQSK